MWKGNEKFMHVLECFGLVYKIHTDTQVDILRFYAERALCAVLVVLFFAIMCYGILLISKLHKAVTNLRQDQPQRVPYTFFRPNPSYVQELELLLNKAENIMASSVEDIPSVYLCPIGLTVMRIPFITHTGKTFELENIERWLQTNGHKCPETRQDTVVVARNFALEELIEKWAHDVIANSEKKTTPSRARRRLTVDCSRVRAKIYVDFPCSARRKLG
jgi:hypothetical protein